MPLAPGLRLGTYEIISVIGVGGMGEVYRARDTRLNRDVAIKVLPELFALDPERLTRFEREAQTLAALNHPNIAQIFGIVDIPATAYADAGPVGLVMECVEGEDLAQRMARAPLEVDEVLSIARQIAEALEAAHDRGIVHRDLKPANVKVSPAGSVKVLDFGLAKAMDSAGAPAADAMNSPTMTVHATQMGVILGTAAYMAPEQARGRAIDKRADIWAFGVVLYEMLAGRRLFDGEDASDILAAVLRQDIHLGAVPSAAPARVVRLLARCLERDPRQRLRDIGEARIALGEIESRTAEPSGPESGASVRRGNSPGRSPRWLGIVAGAAAGAIAVALVSAWLRQPTSPVQPVRLLARLDPDVSLTTVKSATASTALSPDGTTLAFVGTRGSGGAPQLYLRRLDQLTATPVAGTQGAHTPFFSPDGQWIGFFADTALKKVPTAGGTVVTICEVLNPRGAAWTTDNGIVFAPVLGSHGLMKIDPNGGTSVAFTTLPAGMATDRWPAVLPESAGVLYTEHSDITAFDNANLVVLPPHGAAKTVVRGGSNGQYVPNPDGRGGYLVYLSKERLLAVRFDPRSLTTTGDAVPVIDGASMNSTSGLAAFSVASNGSLVYVPGIARSERNPIDWVSADGTVAPLRAAAADWKNPNFSPDGQKLAMDIFDGTQRDLYIYEWGADRLTQLTFDASNEWAPVWSPDGTHIVFTSDRAVKGVGNLYSRKADGTGAIERLTDDPSTDRAGSFDPSGTRLVFDRTDAAGEQTVAVLPIDRTSGRATGPAVPFAANSTGMEALAPSYSPDGRWIAMQSKHGVEVRSASGSGMWRVVVTDATSVNGGIFPRWSPDGRALFVLTGTAIFRTPFSVAGDEFRAGTPVRWSPADYALLGVRDVPYAINPDGRVAISANRQRLGEPVPEVVFVINFGRALSNLLPH
ncbi:MAG TPA: protein kinase [Vicinamibacterales bacterium]|jgi:serine/threonine-protein kinase|nr:protein kinase [Vicinamibacterales bacterium]